MKVTSRTTESDSKAEIYIRALMMKIKITLAVLSKGSARIKSSPARRNVICLVLSNCNESIKISKANASLNTKADGICDERNSKAIKKSLNRRKTQKSFKRTLKCSSV